MLVETLREIKRQPIFSKKSLADKLNVSEDMVGNALEQLKRMGYLEEEKPSHCSGNCKFCSFNCSSSSLNTMVITPKGKKLLSSN
jgi:DNA-binding transcriptional MocR family regulator